MPAAETVTLARPQTVGAHEYPKGAQVEVAAAVAKRMAARGLIEQDPPAKASTDETTKAGKPKK